MNFTKKEIQAVAVGLLALVAVGCLSMVAGQNWESKVTAFPTKTEMDVQKRARLLLDNMTLEEKISQLLLVEYPEDVETLPETGVGGYLLGETWFAGKSTGDVLRDVENLQENLPLAAFIAVQEEGGERVPVSGNKALRAVPFLSPQELLATGGLGLVESDAAEKAKLLRELGITMNFGPVCDVVTEKTAFMLPRALGKDAAATVRYTDKVVSQGVQQNLISVLPGFPGQGNKTAPDAADERSFMALQSSDFLPYGAGIRAGAGVISLSGQIVPALDGEVPASLSSSVCRLLRKDLGFEGVVLSGNLSALSGEEGALAVQALRAGCDMVQVQSGALTAEAIGKAVSEGTLSEERLDESLLRILNLKIQYGIIS